MLIEENLPNSWKLIFERTTNMSSFLQILFIISFRIQIMPINVYFFNSFIDLYTYYEQDK